MLHNHSIECYTQRKHYKKRFNSKFKILEYISNCVAVFIATEYWILNTQFSKTQVISERIFNNKLFVRSRVLSHGTLNTFYYCLQSTHKKYSDFFYKNMCFHRTWKCFGGGNKNLIQILLCISELRQKH